jgi:hypothetical protein
MSENFSLIFLDVTKKVPFSLGFNHPGFFIYSIGLKDLRFFTGIIRKGSNLLLSNMRTAVWD